MRASNNSQNVQVEREEAAQQSGSGPFEADRRSADATGDRINSASGVHLKGSELSFEIDPGPAPQRQFTLNRRSLGDRAEELWRPPPLAADSGQVSRWGTRLRRFFDLQAGSIWRDVEQLLKDSYGKVIDVGCGGQPYRSLLPDSVEYVGIDIADAARNFGYAATDTVYFAGDEWPEQTENADFVLCTEVLEHVPDPADFLARAYGALRPGGRVVCTVPFAARWHFIPFDYWRFTPSGLKRLFEGAGFRDVQVWARGNALTVACYKLMALFLPMLFPQTDSAGAAWARRLLGAPLTPLFLLLAVVANASLAFEGGDDCLGYSVLAQRLR
jgi:SAM-dependent methyltransferase